MAGPIGNQNAKGNKGATYWGKDNREKGATLKGLAINWMITVMNGKDEALKEKVALRIANTCLPQEIKHSGNEDNNTPIPITNISYVQQNNSIPKNNEDVREDKDSTGGNISEQDSINPNILNITSTERQDKDTN